MLPLLVVPRLPFAQHVAAPPSTPGQVRKRSEIARSSNLTRGMHPRHLALYHTLKCACGEGDPTVRGSRSGVTAACAAHLTAIRVSHRLKPHETHPLLRY